MSRQEDMPPRHGFVVLRNDVGIRVYVRADKIISIQPMETPYMLRSIGDEFIYATITTEGGHIYSGMIAAETLRTGEVVRIYDGFDGLAGYQLEHNAADIVQEARAFRRRMDLRREDNNGES